MTGADLTRTCQEPAPFTSAGLVAALETSWAAIRHRHPEVPAAVLVVASGSTARNQLVLGHFAHGRWQHGDRRLPEVLVSGEGLHRPAPEVFTTLLHEATHGLADTRGIKDTSRQGRWHNKRFAALADELGLTATCDPALGWSPCTLRPSTCDTYADTLGGLSAALSAFRHPEQPGPGNGRTSNNNALACECACPRKIRIAVTVLDLGPIYCAVCATEFGPTRGGEPT
jgi:hypothetical protein